MPSPRVSVVVPTYDQDAWLPAALAGLLAQTVTDWECVVVDDGSPGDAATALGDVLADPRVRLEVLARNGGLGAALNRGLDLTSAPVLAYLPSDDLWHAEHLASVLAALDADPHAVLAVSGVRHHQGLTAQEAPGQIPGEPLQLVQVAHRRTPDRWVERSELTTDDLGRMLWDRLAESGGTAMTGRVTCEWSWHPRQRHKVLREPWGGLNPYRSRYRERPPAPRAADGLRILLVGELAHNPERVLALSERGHELHGLWTPDPVWFNTVGPLPFGHVAEVPRDDWRAAVRELRPDVVYGLLNWQAVPFAHEVLTAGLGVPFVWHLKEGPFFSREQGHWPQLVELHTRSDGQIYSSAELRDWFSAVVPESALGTSFVLDGDLPKEESFAGSERLPLLSDTTGDVHTVVPGRPLGPPPEFVADLARRGVHLHLYGEKVAAQMRDWVEEVQRRAPGHLHLHPQVSADRWVPEFSQYDAGWLHDVRSHNGGDVRAATWDDLNLPVRMATLAAAGVPMLMRDNPGQLVASQSLLRSRSLGVIYRDADHLVERLRDRPAMAALRHSVWAQRAAFTFDAHVDELVDFFRKVIAQAS